MMQRFIRSQTSMGAIAKRFFSAGYNYSDQSNSRVFLQLSRNGSNAGRLVFELYDNHSPALALNFAAFCTGQADNYRSYVGTNLSGGIAGYGFHGGAIAADEENWGATQARLPDENLELRHYKRGILSLANDGTNANGS